MTAVRQRVAVVGSGIAGLSAAWLLSRGHEVTLFEQADRLGGHAHTREVNADGRIIAVDTGFIVYNERTYPNLTALFRHLGVPTQPAPMSFAVSIDDGRLEYGSEISGLLAQPGNLLRPRFRRMLLALIRFYREAPGDLATLDRDLTSLGDYLDRGHYDPAFVEDHLLPMAAAIWSAPAATLRLYPAASFIRFFANHGLLAITGKPVWRTVTGGSAVYVKRLSADFAAGTKIRLGARVTGISRGGDGVVMAAAGAEPERFDQIVLACHGDQALGILSDADDRERALLGAFRYQRNETVLHRDRRLMPRRRLAWSSWNHLERRGGADAGAGVTYWMNRLQTLPGDVPILVTLNPIVTPLADLVWHRQTVEHPIFDEAAIAAQRQLSLLQGVRRTWFCGAHFGAGFHEDGLQAGLAVAEALGGARRPWQVADESGRIHLSPPLAAPVLAA